MFNVDKSVLFGRKFQQNILAKKKNKHLRFKAGKDRLTLLFCENVVRFMIRIVLIPKATKP